jgi:arylsulfatase A-like enzyme
MRRLRTVAYLLALALLLGSAAGTQAQTKTKRPANILIFLSDDVGYGEYGFQGNKEIPTPHIDSIAKNGVRFTSGYVSGPYCSPTRAGLLTGRYQTRFGHEFNEGPAAADKFGLPLSERTIAQLLKRLGYSTCCIGKWHLGFAMQFRPMNRGFDEFYGTLANTPYYQPKNFVDSRLSADVREVNDPKFYTTDAYAERAVDWLEKNKGRPWFLYLPFNAQHAPLQAPEKYLDRFRHIQDEKRRTFAAIMSGMDDAVGRILAKIRELGQEEDTLIVFFSDNGGPTAQTTSGNGPLRGFKATTLEGGVRIPFCMQWKGTLPSGKDYHAPIIQLDLLPTCLAAAGSKSDPDMKLDGVNLLPYLTGANTSPPHEALYWRFGNQWAIRKGDWKLVVSSIDGPEPRLFNLADDIGEAKDLSRTHTDKRKELKTQWDAWNAEQAQPLWVPKAGKKEEKKQKKVEPKVIAQAKIVDPRTAPIATGQRVFTCGHSFHVWVPGIVTDLCTMAAISNHTHLGTSSIGGSRVIQHWVIPEEKNKAKEALRTGKVDVLTLSPIFLPDEGIENFTNLALEHNKDIRIVVQPIWLRWDIYEPTTKRPAKVDHNAISVEELRQRHAVHFEKMDAHIRELNQKHGKTVLYVVPAPQAVIALREKIIAGQAPGLKSQEDLFTDELGHGKAPLKTLVGYCNFAVIYRRSPVGLPVPAELKKANFGAEEEPLNRLLQELAWEAVVQHPLSGVRAER